MTTSSTRVRPCSRVSFPAGGVRTRTTAASLGIVIVEEPTRLRVRKAPRTVSFTSRRAGATSKVAMFGRAVVDSLSGRSQFLPTKLIASALAEPPDRGHLRLGWDTKHGATPQCGRRMSGRSFGQLAFTGTSLWCDPERDVVVVLLTNRICLSRANEKIDGFRPAFHDGVLAALAT